MKHISRVGFVMLAAAAVAGCGEKLQAAGNGKNDVAAHQGAQNNFVVAGWKAGDKTSWEQSLKARGQNTQNEYNKIN